MTFIASMFNGLFMGLLLFLFHSSFFWSWPFGKGTEKYVYEYTYVPLWNSKYSGPSQNTPDLFLERKRK